MKKWLIVLIVIAILLTALGIWQKNNIAAIYLYLTSDEEEVEVLVEQSRKQLEEKIKEYNYEAPRNFTPEEEEMIASGEMTIDEAVELILSESEEKQNPESNIIEEDGKEPASETKEPSGEEKTEKTKEEGKDSKSDSASESKTDTSKGSKTDAAKDSKSDTSGNVKSDKNNASEGEIIRRYTAKFYSLKAYYMGQLSRLEASAKSEYASLSKEQKKSLSKPAFAGKYISYATSLQGECDAQVETLLGEMKAELEAIGGDASIVSTIRQTYNAEKAAKKAQYLSLIG